MNTHLRTEVATKASSVTLLKIGDENQWQIAEISLTVSKRQLKDCDVYQN